MEPLTDEASATVRDLVARHHEETGSPVAASLLAVWERARSEFAAVVPRDYRRVLQFRAAAEAAGDDVDTTVMEALRG